MKCLKSALYDRFLCIAGACPDSCCQEWDVQVDADSATRYLALPGALGDALRQKLKHDDQGEYYLKITDRRCPMWRTDGLCEIQAQLGEEALCKVCREFPRLRHDYGDFVELGLELSCPEAARLILTSPAEMPIIEEVTGGEEPDYDRQTMEILLRSRTQALQLLESHSVPEALALLLLYAYAVQEELDGGEAAVCNPEADLALARKAARPSEDQLLHEFYLGLEILTPRWEALLRNPSPAGAWTPELRAMARYGVERYWLQAVSDFDLVCRVKMIVAACVLVRQLGGNVIDTAQLYAKEIENSAENVDAILDAAYTSPAFTDVYLLGQLLL
ncbi:MAG: flagellin lysine-N-methylase [Oscillospiraceae bacterium]|nr:flagellin lysine-N-methylase [Oscillospiraceae bacterium]